MTQQDGIQPTDRPPDDAACAAAALRYKLSDILTPGYAAEFDPDEAEQAGAFVEDGLNLQDAADSCMDLVDADLAAVDAQAPS
jgi:hypothetical protein